MVTNQVTFGTFTITFRRTTLNRKIVKLGEGMSLIRQLNDEVSQTKTSLPPSPGCVPRRPVPAGHRTPDTCPE